MSGAGPKSFRMVRRLQDQKGSLAEIDYVKRSVQKRVDEARGVKRQDVLQLLAHPNVPDG